MSVLPSTSPPVAGAVRARPALIPAFAGLLCLLTLAVAIASDTSPLVDRPVLFGALAASVLVLHFARFDLFGRGFISLATVPTIAIAAIFGPLGAVAAEATVAALSVARREPLIRWGFDFGALSICGVVAALTFAVLPGEPWILITGAVAGLAYYTVNSMLMAGLWLLLEGARPLAAWRERSAWAAPHYPIYGVLGALLVLAERRLDLYAVAAIALPVAIVWLGQKQYLDRSRQSVDQLRESHRKLADANESLRELLHTKSQLLADKSELLERVRLSYLQTVASLARTIEAKDPYTSGHTERVSGYAVLLGQELGFSSEELRSVETGGVIHDIGKIGVRDQVLLKQGRLDNQEWVEMRRHPEISSYILADLEIPEIAKEMARSHHERFDGAGYPDGLVGQAIPLVARVLSVADTLDAMTSDRPYREALPFAKALEELRRNAGSQFCPRVVAALLESYERDPTKWQPARPQTFVAVLDD